MRIVKSICHLGVDKMLKAALGDRLTIARFRDKDGEATDNTKWIADDGMPFDFTYDVDDEYDIKIIDDMKSFEMLKNIKARNTIWYIHGTYHKWPAFQQFWNANVSNVHVLFPDTDRKKYVEKWWKCRSLSEIFLPIHLTDDFFTELPESRNGKAFTIGNNLYQTTAIYGNQNVSDQVFTDMSLSETDLYGFNPVPPPMYDKRLIKGSAHPIKEVVKNYSVSIHPSFVGTFGFALLECMAAGVPVVCPQKVSEYRELCALANTPQDFKRWAKRYIKNEQLSLEVGAKNQSILRKHYNISKYSEKLLEWISKFP